MARRRAGGRGRRQRRNRHHRTHHARPHRTHHRRRHRGIGRRARTRANGSMGIGIQGTPSAGGGAFPRGWTWVCIIGSLCLFTGLALTISHFVYFSRFENFTYIVTGIVMSIIGGILTVVSVCTCIKLRQPTVSRTIEGRVQPLPSQQPLPLGTNGEYPSHIVYTPYISQINQLQTDTPPNYLDHEQEFTTPPPSVHYAASNAPEYTANNEPGYESATAPPPSYEQAIK